jgi:hypothetical protein
MTVTNDQSLLQKLQRCHVLSETLRTNEALREAAGFLLNHSSDNGNVLASAIAVYWGWDRLSQQSVSRVNAGPAVWWCTYTFLTCSAVTANPGWSAGLTGPLHSCLHALCTDRSITRSRQEARPRALSLSWSSSRIAWHAPTCVRAGRLLLPPTFLSRVGHAAGSEQATEWLTTDLARHRRARSLYAVARHSQTLRVVDAGRRPALGPGCSMCNVRV